MAANISIYITNLGKYNEGELVGEWVDLPVTKEEYDAVLKRIGIGEVDDFGTPYEEWFVTDYGGDWGQDAYEQFGEYPNIIELNALARALEDVRDKDLLDAFLETGNWDFWDCIYNAINDNGFLIPGDDWTDAAYYFIDEVDCGPENLPQDTIEEYFDYESLGRDLNFDSYEDDEGNYISAGEYFCGDENASDYDIGEAYVDAVGGIGGVSNPEYYFDYASYGRDLQYDDSLEITSKGILDYMDASSGEGDSLRDDYEKDVERDFAD